MLDPITIGLTGASIGSGLINAFATSRANQLNVASQEKLNARQWELQDYWRQQDRQWSLQDWERMNRYNSPVQQIQRLREAGLNPNLIYGKGADNTASMVRSSSGMSPGGSAPHRQAIHIPDMGMELANAVQASNQNKIAAQTLQNMKSENDLKQQKQLLNDLVMSGIATKNARSAFDLELAKELKDATMLGAKLRNEKMQSEVKSIDTRTRLGVLGYNLQKQELALKKARNDAEINRINHDIAIKVLLHDDMLPAQKRLTEARINSEGFKQQLQKAQAAWEASGMSHNDPMWLRMTVMFIKNKLGIDLGMPSDTTTTKP